MKYAVLHVMVAAVIATALGCAGAISLRPVDAPAVGQDTVFHSYRYASGISGRNRAVFLLMPGIEREVVFDAVQGSRGSGTVADAVRFMEAAAFGKETVFEEIIIEDQRIGYLLTQRRSSFAPSWLEVGLFLRNGRIHFVVWEEETRS